MRKLTTEQFIEKARRIHGDRFGYSLVEYKNNRTKVKIICFDHGVFEQIPDNHLHGAICIKCGFINQRKTNLERYGFECSLQSKEIQEKRRQTNLDKYGVEHNWQSKEIQEKRRQTNLDKYGVEYPIQSKEAQKKQKQTNVERYGVKSITQKHYSKYTLNKLNSFEYIFDEYVNKNKTSRQIGKELSVNKHTICDYLRIHNIPIFKVVSYSKLAIQWLNTIMEKEGIYIQHAGNIGEYRIPNTRYYADGYCKDSRTVYEFYGDCFHGNLEVYREEDHPHPFNPNITTIELYNNSMERENRIRELGYNIVSIWESQYDK